MLYTAILIPYKLGFMTIRAKPPLWLEMLQLFIDILFIIDLFVNMKAAYFSNSEELIVSRKVRFDFGSQYFLENNEKLYENLVHPRFTFISPI